MNENFFLSYQTAEWQRLKNRVLERDNYTCQICGETHGLMQVHHISYKHCKGKAYNSPMGDLITLCGECHGHDDGDHVHFYNGDFYLSAGNQFTHKEPIVLDMRHNNDYWFGFENHIISWRFNYYPYRSIGFRHGGNNWFEIVLGVKGENNIWFSDEFNPHDAVEQRAADIDEVIRLERALNNFIPDFGNCIESIMGEYFVDFEKYSKIQKTMMLGDTATEENQDLLF